MVFVMVNCAGQRTVEAKGICQGGMSLQVSFHMQLTSLQSDIFCNMESIMLTLIACDNTYITFLVIFCFFTHLR